MMFIIAIIEHLYQADSQVEKGREEVSGSSTKAKIDESALVGEVQIVKFG